MATPSSPFDSPPVPSWAPRNRPVVSFAGLTPETERLGKYRLLRRLGKGGTGVVYEAEDPVLRRRVALKLLPLDLAGNPESLHRFLREGQTAARLRHPNVVAVHDVDQRDGIWFIVMELVPGGSAQDYLTSHGPFAWMHATALLADACRGLAAAHSQGLIHRDIKPGNLLMTGGENPGLPAAKLTDFGLVKQTHHTGTVLTTLGTIVGTPQYMSPEQCRGEKVDERSDLYALGATYFALLTARPPFGGTDLAQILAAQCNLEVPDPRTLEPELPLACVTIVRRAMAKQRDLRFATAADMLAALEALLAPIPAAPVPSTATPMGTSSTAPPPAPPALHLPERMLSPVPARRSSTLLRRTCTWLATVTMLSLAAGTVVCAINWWWDRLSNSTDNGASTAATVPMPASPAADDGRELMERAEMVALTHNAREMEKVLAEFTAWRVTQQVFGRELQEAEARLLQALAFRKQITARGLALPMPGRVEAVAVSPDGRWLAAATADGQGAVHVWDFVTGELHWPTGNRRRPSAVNAHSLAFSPDGKTLAAGCGAQKAIKLWHVETGAERMLAVDPKVLRVLAVAFSADGQRLAAGLDLMEDRATAAFVKLWEMPGGKALPSAAGHSSRVWSVAFSPSAPLLASGSNDKTVLLWDPRNGHCLEALPAGVSVTCLEFNHAGTTLAVAGYGSKGQVVQFWDATQLRLKETRPVGGGYPRGLAFAPGDGELAVALESRWQLWRTGTPEVLATCADPPQGTHRVAFAPRGGIVATACWDRAVRLWDVTALAGQ
jgi:serine/threonine protein kinase/WD40 repeat protein